MSGAPTGVPGDWHEGRLPGVLLRRMAIHPDARGAFGELWRADWTDPFGARMVQANLSRSRKGVLRGLHFHQHQADLWIVAEGQPLVALVDLRAAVAGTGRPVVDIIETQPGDTLYLPAGVAHGFYAPEDMTLIYLVTNVYDGTDELGFRWDDPDAGVSWPDPAPVLSDRDAAAPSLASLLERLRAG